MIKIRTRYLWVAAFLVLGAACQKKAATDPEKESGKETSNAVIDYEQEMRTFIQDISSWSRQQKPGFLIVPQDGLTLLTTNGDTTGTPETIYWEQ